MSSYEGEAYMKRLVCLLLACMMKFSLCACSTGTGGIASQTSEESPSQSSTAISEISEVSSDGGIAADYKNSPNFLPIGNMEFTVIDNTAVPEFEGVGVEVDIGYFTSLEGALTGEKMSKLKKEQEIQGLQISPDGKNCAYFLITYIPDEITGEVTYFDNYSAPFMVASVQFIVECDGKTKEFWRADNYLMEGVFYYSLMWLDNEYISWSTEGIHIYNVNSGDSFKMTIPDFMKNRKEYDGISSYGGIREGYESKNGIAPFLGRLSEDNETESYYHYYLCFYNLKEKQWLENYIHFTELEYTRFCINWSEQTDNLLIFLQEEKIDGYTFYLWEYNPITNQKVEIKALKCKSEPMEVVDIRDDLIIWDQAKPMGAPAKVFLYDYKKDQWFCYVNGLYHSVFHKNKNLLRIDEEVIDDRPQYIGNDIFVYDLKNKVKYYHLTRRTGNDE